MSGPYTRRLVQAARDSEARLLVLEERIHQLVDEVRDSGPTDWETLRQARQHLRQAARLVSQERHKLLQVARQDTV